MSAYAWYRRRMNRNRVREDLRQLNSGEGLAAFMAYLAKPEPWKWRKTFLKREVV